MKPLYRFKISSLRNWRDTEETRNTYIADNHLTNTYIWLPKLLHLCFLSTIYSILFFFCSPYFSSYYFQPRLFYFLAWVLVFIWFGGFFPQGELLTFLCSSLQILFFKHHEITQQHLPSQGIDLKIVKRAYNFCLLFLYSTTNRTL